MTKAEILKKEILRQYRSVRQFAMEMNIPYSTLVTALERGIEGCAGYPGQSGAAPAGGRKHCTEDGRSGRALRTA